MNIRNKRLIYQNDDAALLWGKSRCISSQSGSDQRLSPFQIVRKEKLGIKLLPNCKEFRITLGETNSLFKLAGVTIKEEPRIAIDPHLNKGANRFVVRQLLRLKRSVGDPKLFWRIAWSLMGSNSYIVTVLHKTKMDWHREMPYYGVLKLCRKVKSYVKSRETGLRYHRVYIPKGDGKVRPLGVPEISWRVYLSGYSIILRILLHDYFPTSQHAYLPQRGVVTAWREVIDKVINSKDIYEFDLKQFFPSVNVAYIMEILKMEFGVPTAEINFLKGICRQTPELPKNLLLDESKVLKKKSINKADPYVQWWWDTNSDIARLFDKESSAGMANRQYHIWDRNRVKYLRYKRDVLGLARVRPHNFNEEWAKNTYYQRQYYEGVAQGTPIAPILSILALVMPLQEQVPTVMYADDGVIYGSNLGDKPFPTGFDVHESGIQLHEEKSRWVKRDGKWLRPLKFLGMEYDGNQGTFRANTRKGSTLEFTDDVKFILWLSANVKEIGPYGTKLSQKLDFEALLGEYWEKYSESSWQDLFRGKFVGFVFSRLQGSSWSPDITQDFGLEFMKGSWMDVCAPWYCEVHKLTEGMNVFNSSTFASHCLLSDLRRGNRYRDDKKIMQGLHLLSLKLRNKFQGLYRKIKLKLT